MSDMTTYLTLERAMLELDRDQNPLADDLRDLMDPLWYELSDTEREQLNSRGFVDHEAHVAVTSDNHGPLEWWRGQWWRWRLRGGAPVAFVQVDSAEQLPPPALGGGSS